MQTLNEFLEKHYIDNIETLEKSIQVLEKKNSPETKYFFNNIIFFTNERDPKKNKTCFLVNQKIMVKTFFYMVYS